MRYAGNVNQRQRESVARYLYDLSKIVFATAVVGNLVAWENFNVINLVLGGITVWVFLKWGLSLDEEKR